MSRIHDLLRALRYRWAGSLLVFVLATVAVAAATVGPTYNAAARTSIVQDTFSAAPGIEQGIEASESGPLNGILPPLQAAVQSDAAKAFGGAAAARAVLGTPIDSITTVVGVRAASTQITLAWRDLECDRLHLVSGHCPTQPSQIMISPSVASKNHWRVGTQVSAHPFSLVVTGIYAIPDLNSPYWELPATPYFPTEEDAGTTHSPTNVDAAFTVRQTLSNAPAPQQGADTVDLLVNVPAVTTTAVNQLGRTGQLMLDDEAITDQQAVVLTSIPIAVHDVHVSWNTLTTPVLVITGELLVLIWLLLFLVVVDAVEARGAEVALARLRGYGRWRSVVVAVAEPVTVLAVALPVGALLGWVAAREIGHNLRPGTPIPLVFGSWIAAVLATLGGIAAVLTAARRVLRRPVVEQWRRTSRGANRRGWVVDGVLLTAAGAGLLQLGSAGAFATTGASTKSHDSLALLVPALIGIAVAVVASRLLPLVCRAVFGVTRGYGGVASFLAVRHVARRPGGTRTVIVLVTAFALATFATQNWSIAHNNRHRVAAVTAGAATVLNVQASSAIHLENAVDAADPSGHKAAAVVAYYAGTTTLLAVQPLRFARVAAWGAAGAAQPGGLGGLAPRAPAPIVLTGDAVRVQLQSGMLNTPSRLGMDRLIPEGAPPSPIDLGPLPANFGEVTRTASLSGCPCTLSDMTLAPPALQTPLQGHVVLRDIEVRNHGVWQALPDVIDATHWRPAEVADNIAASASNTLTWTFSTQPTTDATLYVADRPNPIPVVLARSLLNGPLTVTGLDGSPLTTSTLQTAPAIPGAPTTGVVTDLTYAERAALDGDVAANQQVWVASGAAAAITKRLKSDGVRILSTTEQATYAAQLGRQGPGLAGSLFLLDAIAAALLAALGAVVSLAVSARRRRYEYAALAAGGVSRPVLRRSLVIEQLLVLFTGAIIGVATGIFATIVAVRSVPEFVTPPTSPPLSYAPTVVVSVIVLVVALVALLTVAMAASGSLVQAARPSLLREPPQ